MTKGLLLVTTSFPQGPPGSEAAGAFVREWAHELSGHCRVAVVAPGPETRIERWDGISIYRYAAPTRPLSTLQPRRPADWRLIVGTLRSGAVAVRRALEREQIDHALALWALPSGLWLRSECRKRSIPWSVWALGSDIWQLRRIPGVRTLLRQVLEQADNRFADGYQLAADVEGLSARSCMFLPSCRSLASAGRPRIRTQHPPYRLAFLGRWHPNKGIDLLFDALDCLNDQDWGRIAEVRIAGGGPLTGLVRERSEGLRARGRPVTTLGFLGREDAVALLDWADYLVLPSRIESIPVVFSDAAQRGCPMIATPVGDLPRLHADRPFGVLADACSGNAIADAICKALSMSPLKYRSALESHANEFSVAECASRLVGILLCARR